MVLTHAPKQALVDVRVLENFIIGQGKTLSFAERGLLRLVAAGLVAAGWCFTGLAADVAPLFAVFMGTKKVGAPKRSPDQSNLAGQLPHGDRIDDHLH